MTADARYVPGDVVGIGIGGVGITLARIAWAEERSYGCAFLDQLAPGRVTAAFEATNLIDFTGAHAMHGPTQHRQRPGVRWPVLATAALAGGGGLLLWAAIAAAALAFA